MHFLIVLNVLVAHVLKMVQTDFVVAEYVANSAMFWNFSFS